MYLGNSDELDGFIDTQIYIHNIASLLEQGCNMA